MTTEPSTSKPGIERVAEPASEDHGLALQGEFPGLASAHGDGAVGTE